MKQKIILPIAIFLCNTIFSQTILVLQPDALQGKDALIWELVDQSGVFGPTNTTNYGSIPQYSASEWTWNGSSGTRKSLLDFDLSSIPVGSTITEAYLSLYAYPNSADGGHSTLSGSNSCYLSQITSPWDENSVSWNTQPLVNSVGQLILAQSTTQNDNYLDIDVTSFIQDKLLNPSTNHGFCLSMINQNYYRSMIFASSDNVDVLKHPKLVVIYTEPDSLIDLCLQPNSVEGKDALIWELADQSGVFGPTNTTNYGSIPQYSASEWTWNGSSGTRKSLLDFDLSSIPVGSTITEAYLSLYAYPSSADGGHSTLSGSNSCYLSQITSPWDENSVTWNTQPLVNSVGQLILAQSSTQNDNYLNIDVTSFIQDKLLNPSTNHGFCLSMINQNYYRSMIFASSDNVDAIKHPKLCIKYKTLDIKEQEAKLDYSIYPNPSTGIFTLYSNSLFSYSVYNLMGQKIYSSILNQSNNEIIDLSNEQKGIYFIEITINGVKSVKKVQVL